MLNVLTLFLTCISSPSPETSSRKTVRKHNVPTENTSQMQKKVTEMEDKKHGSTVESNNGEICYHRNLAAVPDDL